MRLIDLLFAYYHDYPVTNTNVEQKQVKNTCTRNLFKVVHVHVYPKSGPLSMKNECCYKINMYMI